MQARAHVLLSRPHQPATLPFLLQGEGQVGIKSAAGLARAMASHPDAIGAILKQLTVQPKN